MKKDAKEHAVIVLDGDSGDYMGAVTSYILAFILFHVEQKERIESCQPKDMLLDCGGRACNLSGSILRIRY